MHARSASHQKVGVLSETRILEPPLGFEPRTFALQKRCSTAELRWHCIAPYPTSSFALVAGTAAAPLGRASPVPRAGAKVANTDSSYNGVLSFTILRITSFLYSNVPFQRELERNTRLLFYKFIPNVFSFSRMRGFPTVPTGLPGVFYHCLLFLAFPLIFGARSVFSLSSPNSRSHQMRRALEILPKNRKAFVY